MREFKDRFLRMFIMAFRQMQDPYYQGFAAQVSFYLVLSIVPIIILIVQLLGLFNISMGTALNLLYEYTGHQISGLIRGLFEFSSLGFGNIVYIFIALWAGSRASFSLTRIANYTLTEGSSTGRNYFVERVRAIGTLFVTIATIVFSIVILCYGKLILSGILNLIGRDTQAVDSMWLWLRWPLGFVLYFCMIGFNYYMLPTQRRSFQHVIPGTFFAAVGLLIVTAAYSVYTSSLANYDIVYGALSSVVAILIWFFFLAWVLLLGVMFNKVWEDTSTPFSKRRPPEHLILEKEWKQSKFDADPRDVGIGMIKDILMGDDHPGEPEDEDPAPEPEEASKEQPDDRAEELSDDNTKNPPEDEDHPAG